MIDDHQRIFVFSSSTVYCTTVRTAVAAVVIAIVTIVTVLTQCDGNRYDVSLRRPAFEHC
jgi:hypothetical protein